VFDGVSRVPAGHVLEWRHGVATCEPYWRPKFGQKRTASLEDQEARFLDLVESAVEREAENGDVGAYLSGGTDSSTIAGMLCKVTGKPAKTYSIGFDASGYDEMEYARIAARHFGADHNEYYVTPEDLLGGIPKVAVHYDQPFGNSSAVPAWVCAARAKADGLDKVLAGDGGDELFGGNERYAKQRVFERYALIPKLLRRYAFEPASKLPGINKLPIIRKAASYVQQSRVPLPDRLYTYNLLLRIGTILTRGLQLII
jgi:asparagine synthase (glutamine-hydrolysing)